MNAISSGTDLTGLGVQELSDEELMLIDGGKSLAYWAGYIAGTFMEGAVEAIRISAEIDQNTPDDFWS